MCYLFGLFRGRAKWHPLRYVCECSCHQFQEWVTVSKGDACMLLQMAATAVCCQQHDAWVPIIS